MVKYNKPKLWNGKNLRGDWLVTRKLDGVRAFVDFDNCTAVSRNGKPLYGFDNLFSMYKGQWDFEVFCGSWEETIAYTRTINGPKLKPDHLYDLVDLDDRLDIGYVNDPTAEIINEKLNRVVGDGDEGLVLRQGDKWIKVKPSETYDVYIMSLQEGTNKNVGKLGAFLTDMGKVGTGFTDKQRELYFDLDMIGKCIEVECMSLTKDGKFRHPRFKRLRLDK